MSDQFVDAGSPKKFHFTKTIISTQDPGEGHENQQLAMILSPNQGTIYDGSITFTSSEPVQITVLHEINPDESKGQPTWSIDGKIIYGISLIDPAKQSGSTDFTGAALALHSSTSKEFTATVSVDGWIRGQPTEIITQTIELEKSEPSTFLSRTNIPVTIPMHKGMYNDKPVFYIITDSSDDEYAKRLSEKQGWKVETAQALENLSEKIKQKIYVFNNGISGNGMHGFQDDLFATTPSQLNYTAFGSITEVTWKKGQTISILKSANDVIKAHKDGRVTFDEPGVILNTPQIAWPDGQIKIKDEKITDESSYAGGQVTAIDNDSMTVTFVAHRGWGPDGRTEYCIATDGIPSTIAEMMGTTYTPTYSEFESNPAIIDMFHFKNGIKGNGPLGFQSGISSVSSSDEGYSPLWRVQLVEWNNPESAKILETTSDIDYFLENDEITVSLAQHFDSDYLINCPMINPFQ